MIRLATQEDNNTICHLAQAFFLASPYADLPWDKEFVNEQIEAHLSASPLDRLTILLQKDEEIVGILASLVSFLPLSPIRIASELLWYVIPEYRGRESLLLLDAYEYWAKNVANVDVIQVVNLANLDLGKLYERRGYVKTETAYMKKIT